MTDAESKPPKTDFPLNMIHTLEDNIRQLEADLARKAEELEKCTLRITNTPPGENGKKYRGVEAINYLLAEVASLRRELEEARAERDRLREQSWEEAKDEMIFHANGPREPEDKITPEHLEAMCAQMPLHADKLRDYAQSWNAEPRITQEMLNAVEMPDDAPEVVSKSFQRAMSVFRFHDKLKAMEARVQAAEQDAAALREALERMGNLAARATEIARRGGLAGQAERDEVEAIRQQIYECAALARKEP